LNGQVATVRSGRDDVRASGARVEELLAGFERPLPLAKSRARAEELVRSLVQLYGNALDRMLEIVDAEAGESADRIFAKLFADPLISGLLVVHGLHPLTTLERVQRALDGVRPYIESHQGRVEVLGVDGSTVLLRMAGSCDGCPSSAATLKLAIERAIFDACPEITEVRAEGVQPESDAPLSLRVISA
jgi:Fe-S cluster biogenesis protein NfuA